MPYRRPDGSRSAVLDVDRLRFAYGDGRAVFHDFSLKVRSGEFVALLGPSGCGKTTLLNLLSGFLAPDAGSIRIDGAPVRPEAPGLGYVFQTANLFPWLSVLENIRFGLRMRGDSLASQDERSRKYLALVELDHLADEMPHRLSGGQRQRVAIARTLALEPSLLLMDEPFGALDAITRMTMNEELLRLWSTLRQSILFITHDIDEAIFLSDRVVTLGLPPTGVHDEIAIDLPRPRDRVKTRAAPRFAELNAHLLRGIGAATSRAHEREGCVA